MAQFIVRAYRTAHGYRVVVDGITHFDVAEESAIDPRAQTAILERLRAFLPPRARPPTEPGALAIRFYDLRLEPVDPPPSLAPVAEPPSAPRAPPPATPAVSARPGVGRRLRGPIGESGRRPRRE